MAGCRQYPQNRLGTLDWRPPQPEAADAAGTPEFCPLTDRAILRARIYETALSNTADFNYVFDLQGRFLYINRALLELWGKQADEALGRNFFELDYPPELAAKLQRQIQEVIATKQPLRDETPYTSAAGTRAYEYIFVPAFDAEGRVEAVTGSTRDITERKQTEEKLRDAQAGFWRKRWPCAMRTGARTSFSPCWRMSCAIPWRA